MEIGFPCHQHVCSFQDNSSKKWTGEWTCGSDSLTAVAEILNKYIGTDCEEGEGKDLVWPLLGNGSCERHSTSLMRSVGVPPSSPSRWRRKVPPYVCWNTLCLWHSVLQLLGFGFWRPAQAGRHPFDVYKSWSRIASTRRQSSLP